MSDPEIAIEYAMQVNRAAVNLTGFDAILDCGPAYGPRSGCLTTNCAMTTPNLGTPSAVNLASATNIGSADASTNAGVTAKPLTTFTRRWRS